MGGHHFEISPSGSSSWLKCPGGVILRRTLKLKDETNIYAEEGTAAHELFETCIISGSRADDLIGATFNGFEVTTGMANAVNLALDWVANLEHSRPGGLPATEMRVDLGHIYDGMFGSIDYHLFDPDSGHLVVADYKHGQGVVVEAENNTQLLLYASGVARHHEGVTGITLAILQPRAPHPDGPVRTWDVPIADLEAFEETARETARLIMEQPEVASKQLHAGETQCRWCEAFPICPEAAKQAQEQARIDFNELDENGDPVVDADLETLSIDDLSNIMLGVDFARLWMNAVEAHVHGLLEQGVAVPMFKLVRGRSLRRWKDAEATMDFFKRYKVKTDDYAPRKLCSPAQAEKLKLSPGARKVLGEFWEKPEGALKLARSSDPRPAVVVEGFEELDD